MNSEKDTLPNNETILNAIKELRQEMNSKFDANDQKIITLQNQVTDLRNEVDARFEDMRLQMMSVDVRIDRIEALTHEVLNVAYNARADVKVLREEVHSWSKELHGLQLKIA